VARGFWEDWVVIGAATSLVSGGVGTAKPDKKGDGGYKIQMVCAASQKTATLRFLFTVSLMTLRDLGEQEAEGVHEARVIGFCIECGLEGISASIATGGLENKALILTCLILNEARV